MQQGLKIMKLLHVLFCVSLLLLTDGVFPEVKRFERQAPAYPVWLLGEDVRYTGGYVKWFTGCDTTNVVALTEDNMHVDYFSTVETIREVRFNLELPAKHVMIRMINDTQQDEVFVAAQFGHMSVNRFGYYKTFPIPTQYPLSLFMIEDLACVANQNFSVSNNATGMKNGNGNRYNPNSDSITENWNRDIKDSHSNPNIDSEGTKFGTKDNSTGSVVCVNVKTRMSLVCSDAVGQYFKSKFYTTDPQITKQRAYVFDESGTTVHEFQVHEGCLAHVRDLPVPKSDPPASRLWSSYDGSSVFLDNGYVLKTTDFSVQGEMKMNSSSGGGGRFKWISQLFTDEDLSEGSRRKRDDHSRPIMALDLQDKVYVYSWPDLTNTKVYDIPIPKRKGADYIVSEASDVHYRYRKSLAYVMTQYKDTKSGNVRLGVGFVLSV